MVSSSNLVLIQGPFLVGKNCDFYSLRMKSFIQAQECQEPVENGFTEAPLIDLNSMKNAYRNYLVELRKKENKARYWIQNSVDDTIFSKINGASIEK